jgi:uncharacterized membrane protein YhiD involved in acid resistance
MNFVDLIKQGVLEEFTGTVSSVGIVLSLICAFAIAFYIVIIYRRSYTGVMFSKSFALTIILLSMVTALIIRTISSNLALSLGMVGALSIVRFRTAVKDPVDTAFMFWGITAGIMAGTGLYLVAIISSLAVGVLYLFSQSLGFGTTNQFLLVIRYEEIAESAIMIELAKLGKIKLKTKSISGTTTELTYEIALNKDKVEFLSRIKSINGVKNATVLSYQNDFGV